MKEVRLTIGTVEIVDSITWGMQEALRNEVLAGMKMSGFTNVDKQNLELNPSVLGKAKYKALELCIKKIILTDGKEVSYSKEWMDGLSIEDGDKLFEAVDEVTNPKKK